MTAKVQHGCLSGTASIKQDQHLLFICAFEDYWHLFFLDFSFAPLHLRYCCCLAVRRKMWGRLSPRATSGNPSATSLSQINAQFSN